MTAAARFCKGCSALVGFGRFGDEGPRILGLLGFWVEDFGAFEFLGIWVEYFGAFEFLGIWV